MKPRQKKRMTMFVLIFILAMCIVLAIAMASSVRAAPLSAAQTVTWELDPAHGLVTIYTTVVDYEFNPNWMATFVIDAHPVLGTDVDVSATRYFSPLGMMLYATIGVRRGLINSSRGWTPYVAVTMRF